MPDDPKPATAADLATLTARVGDLEKHVAAALAERVEDIKKGRALADTVPALERRVTALETSGRPKASPVTDFPWRHRANRKQLARIIGQGTETEFEVLDGPVLTLPTHEFNAQYEDASAV